MALYLAIAVIVLAVFGPRWLRGEPDFFGDMAAVVGSAAALRRPPARKACCRPRPPFFLAWPVDADVASWR